MSYGSCKYGSECGMYAACVCDCCLDAHMCECGGLDEGSDEHWEPDDEPPQDPPTEGEEP